VVRRVTVFEVDLIVSYGWIIGVVVVVVAWVQDLCLWVELCGMYNLDWCGEGEEGGGCWRGSLTVEITKDRFNNV
jgi:hypothetical protein